MSKDNEHDKDAELIKNLEERSRRFETLLSNLPGTAYRCLNDKDWTMEFLSDGCLELTGYDPSDLAGNRYASYASLILSEDRDYVWNEIQAALGKGRPFILFYRICTAEGVIKWVREKGCGVFESGNLTALEGFIEDITEQKKLEESLRKAFRDEQILVKEIHHRVKNNLSMLMSLVNMQKESVDSKEPVHFLNDLENRIYAVYLVHEHLYKTESVSNIRADNYITELVSFIQGMHMPFFENIKAVFHFDEILLPTSEIIPLGLIINEIITNFFKHSFAEDSEGTITIALRHDDSDIVLEIGSDGLPFEENEKAGGMGMLLIESLIKQLNGRLALKKSPYVFYTIRFPAE